MSLVEVLEGLVTSYGGTVAKRYWDNWHEDHILVTHPRLTRPLEVIDMGLGSYQLITSIAGVSGEPRTVPLNCQQDDLEKALNLIFSSLQPPEAEALKGGLN